jgi:hypothetical protein
MDCVRADEQRLDVLRAINTCTQRITVCLSLRGYC